MIVNRRDFARVSFAMAGLLGVESPQPSSAVPFQAESNPALGAGGFRLGLVTYNLARDWDLSMLIKNCQQTGFEAVELRTSHKHGVEPSLGKQQRNEVRQRFADSPVRLLSLGSTCEYHSPDPTIVTKNIQETKRFIELAHDIGALGVKVRPNGIPREVPEEKTLMQIGKSLRECGVAGANYGVEIWLEVHGKDSCRPARIQRIMQNTDHPQVGVCWNSNPEDVEHGSVRNSFEMLKPWLRNSHINELWINDYPWRELFGLMTSVLISSLPRVFLNMWGPSRRRNSLKYPSS